MLISITQAELDKARKALDVAVARGFTASEAVFKAQRLDKYGNLYLKYDQLCDKAHPTDLHANWGCQNTSKYNKVVDGKLVPLDLEPEN